ncbi:MAG TPA: putative zinc-binding metallopeptidase, partial [Candidatus Acidoferrales bacterium]|nr:putative zinc-binding metallopeptidase [Candidatus Acidoferrales bacterium]
DEAPPSEPTTVSSVSTAPPKVMRVNPGAVDWPDERLLDVRMSDLDIAISGSDLQTQIDQLYAELDARGIRFRPFFWLSDEWFTPDGVPGIAVPFYLAHPRLMRLELNQMLEVEGGTSEWCMRILRHETGHAIDNAYNLRRRGRRRELFGNSSQEYPEHYAPRPYSRSFVVHLESWYAQSHPDEDFAETFAVWLTPGSTWREEYAEWPTALKKLEYMDALMHEIGSREPRVTSGRRIDSLRTLRKTLRTHYRQRRERYGVGVSQSFDSDLRRLFSDAPQYERNLRAARFLTRLRPQVRRTVALWTGAYQYTIDQVLVEIIRRCRELNLRLTQSEEQTAMQFTVLLTVQTMNYLHTGQHRVWL